MLANILQSYKYTESRRDSKKIYCARVSVHTVLNIIYVSPTHIMRDHFETK